MRRDPADGLGCGRGGCRTAGIGYLGGKKIMITHVVADVEPIRARRAELETRPADVADVLREGNRRARVVAEETMAEVREGIQL